MGGSENKVNFVLCVLQSGTVCVGVFMRMQVTDKNIYEKRVLQSKREREMIMAMCYLSNLHKAVAVICNSS